MIKTKLTFNKEALVRKVKSQLVSNEVIDELDREVVGEIKRFMAAGTSPVRGKRRFPAYKTPEKYPANKKPSRPVNLFLSGDLYNSLKAAKVSVLSFYIGVSSLASEKIKTYAKANNLGENGIPERRFIPIRGEQFNISIMRKIKDIIARRIAEIINK